MGSFILSGRRPTGNRFHTAQALGIHFVLALALLSLLVSANCSATIQDVIFGDGFDGFDLTTCDAGLTSDSSDAAQYAAAIDLCKTTTEQAAGWGLISATLTLPPGTGTPEPISRGFRRHSVRASRRAPERRWRCCPRASQSTQARLYSFRSSPA